MKKIIVDVHFDSNGNLDYKRNQVVSDYLRARFVFERSVYLRIAWWRHPIQKIVWWDRVRACENAIRRYYSFIQKHQKIQINSTYGTGFSNIKRVTYI